MHGNMKSTMHSKLLKALLFYNTYLQRHSHKEYQYKKEHNYCG